MLDSALGVGTVMLRREALAGMGEGMGRLLPEGAMKAVVGDSQGPGIQRAL